MLFLVVSKIIFTYYCLFLQLNGIVYYNYIAFYKTYMIDKVYRNIIIIILGKLYELSICRSNFGHKNSNFNTLSQHKIHLMYVNILCVQNLVNIDYILVVFGSQFDSHFIGHK